MHPTQWLLTRVQRHLLRERLAAAARYAAWGSAGIAALGALLQLVVRPVSLPELLAALGLPWLLALLQVITTRARPAECAAWADRSLGGRSAYATWLEMSAASRDAAAPAIAHLEDWLAKSTPDRLAQLAAWPFDAGLRKPVSAALVCSALAFALLQLPARPLAADREALQTAAHSNATDASEQPADEPGAAAERAIGTGLGDEGNADLAALERQQRGATAADADAGDVAAETDDETGSTPGDSAEAKATARVTSTGREAGDSADTGADAAFTTPWQGELAARLRQVTGVPEREALRADATRAADYDEQPIAGGNASAGVLSAAAATPSPARPALRLGPAEQAYLRAYFADSGASP